MERAQFVETVKKLEEFSAREPERYRRRVGLLAAVGYGYVLFVLLVVLALLAAMIWIALVGHHVNALLIKLGLFLLIFAYLIIRSLWVRFTPPSGIALTPDKAPELFTMIDELTQKLQAPRFHQVMLNDEFNAAVMQLPRLGLLGWQKNYLLLGLPLMQALSADEFRAVVAHELGHLSGSHGKFGGWIYRIYQTWEQLQQNFAHSGHSGAWVFEKFLNWYAPYFGAYSFVLRRADEYVADHCSANLTSKQAAASALVGVRVKGRYLEEVFWPRQFRKIAESATAPTAPFAELASRLRAPFAPETTMPGTPAATAFQPATPPVSRWLARAFRDKTDYADTHPSLADRLQSLGFETKNQLSEQEYARWLASLECHSTAPSAAAHYLGASETELTRQLDAQWHQAVAEQWQERHQAMQQAKTRLKELEEKAQSAPLSTGELWEQTTITHDLHGNQTALPLAEQVLEREPGHAAAHYALGQMLLDRDDEAGIEHLLRAAQLESDATLAAYGSIYHFLLDHGREEEAEKYRDQSYDFQDTVEKAMEERAQITERDEYLPPKISDEELAKLREFLQSQKGVAQAHLACKKVEHFDNKPLHILGLVRTRGSAFKLSADNEKFIQEFLTQLHNWEDHPIGFVFVMDGNSKKLTKKIADVPGSQIYAATS